MHRQSTVKPSDQDSWEERKERVIGLGERSFRKSYYPQLRQNIERLERFRTLLDGTSDVVVLVALPEGTIADANAVFGRLLGKNVDLLIGQPFDSIGFGEVSMVLEALSREMKTLSDGDEIPSHSVVVKFSGSETAIWFELSYRIAILDGRHFGVMVGRDITERKCHHEMVTALLAEKEALLDNALVGIALVKQRRFVSCNRRLEEILGYPADKIVGQSTRLLYSSEEAFATFGDDAYRCFAAGQSYTATLMLARSDGSTFWAELAGRSIDASNPHDGSIWIVSDVTDRKLAEAKAEFLSNYDPLTRLPNQLLLKDRLQQAIAFSNRSGTKVALIVVDLDRFKTINDILGHSVGNQLLVDVAGRLSSCMRATDTVSRQGGDEFLLLLTNLAEPDAVVTFLGQLVAKMLEPFVIEGKELTTSISAGVAIYPEDGADFETLLKKADMAMYRAKEAGRNTYRFFNEDMNDGAIEQITLQAGLRRAIENQQFVLHYQPQIEVSSGALIGAEALVRWQHPDLGLVSPGRFIPVAEETGLIVEIGDWVLREACLEVARWRQAGMHEPVVAVNLSALQFKRGNIEQSVAHALEASGVDPSMLELELTESILIRDTDNVLATVKRLKLMGIKLSIDDFGTGYSSLSYLKRFEVDKLKIDQSFIRDLATDPEDAAIVRAIIQMARSLGLRTIAEGVENKQVFDYLRLYHCDETQGYYHGRPMPAQDFMAYLASHLAGAWTPGG